MVVGTMRAAGRNLASHRFLVSAHCLWGKSEGSEEGTTHALGICETRFLRDDFNGVTSSSIMNRAASSRRCSTAFAGD
jgi:hypothetical protein